MTFFRRKPGHLLYPGRALCGSVSLADIAIPAAVLSDPSVAVTAPTYANAPGLWLCELPAPQPTSHKYARGHTLVVSGAIQMSGAARLAATAALRAGSGLVTIAAPEETMIAHASATKNAILLSSGQRAEHLRRLLADPRKNAVVVGPGLGLGDGEFDIVMQILSSSAATVLDADALTLGSRAKADFFRPILGEPDRAVVMTPHEGEFHRLFPDLAGDKLTRAREAARRSGATIVLKGPDTVIAAPDGRAAINDNAPPGLATGGSGDVLAGIIAGLLAQSMPPWPAACAAVWMHGKAASAFGPGLIADDLPEQLPAVLRALSPMQSTQPDTSPRIR